MTHDHNGTASLEARIDRLEAELRHWQSRAATGVTTRQVTLVDEQGHERATLTADAGGPTIEFRDETGMVRLKLTLAASGPGMTLADEVGHTRAWLGFTKEALRIGFADEDGNSRAFFGVMRSGQPVAKFYDAAGNVVWSAE